MKKIFGTIAAVFGFLGVAMVAVFFMETINVNPPASGTNLTADIAANDAQLADVSAAVDPGTADSSSIATAIATATTTVAADADVPAVVPVVLTPAPASAPASTPEPLPPQLDPTPVTSTVATATITVTPTAPPTSPAPPTSVPASASAPTNVSPVNSPSLPYNETDFAGDNNWQATWGVMKTTWENFIDLSAGPTSDGGAIYLKNSGTWANYTMTATLDWIGGNTIGLMADYENASNYDLCQYSKTGPGVITMQLVQYVNGSEVPLSPAAPVSWTGDGSGLGFSMQVDGVYGTCLFNGQTVSNEGAGAGRVAMSSFGSGGIGFTVRDASPDTSEIIVRQVEVVQK